MVTISVISFIVMAIWFSMQEGEIFGKLGAWMYNALPAWMHKPLFDCPICMTPWYGTAIYALLPGPFVVSYWWWAVLAAMGLNVIIVKLWPDKD